MKIKPVRVLDAGTDVFFLVGKVDESDGEWMRWSGWGGYPTLVVKMRAERTWAMISHFDCPEIDIEERGFSLDSTILGFVNAVKDLSFEQIPDLIDLRRIEEAS